MKVDNGNIVQLVTGLNGRNLDNCVLFDERTRMFKNMKTWLCWFREINEYTQNTTRRSRFEPSKCWSLKYWTFLLEAETIIFWTFSYHEVGVRQLTFPSAALKRMESIIAVVKLVQLVSYMETWVCFANCRKYYKPRELQWRDVEGANRRDILGWKEERQQTIEDCWSLALIGSSLIISCKSMESSEASRRQQGHRAVQLIHSSPQIVVEVFIIIIIALSSSHIAMTSLSSPSFSSSSLSDATSWYSSLK